MVWYRGFTGMKRMIRKAMLIGALGALSACSSSLEPSIDLCPPGDVCVQGSVEYVTVEGGFWAVQGDDRVLYELLDGVPEQLREDGLRVYLQGRIRRDMGSVHMAGPILEVTTLRRLP